ncbi:hypothetical protein HGRIS_007620 [Hohenbuehelia grisea]|uniref:Uncharacterized protein n=1 Tax=Hohenbuehelia grisea TaxID=104357 RepID=A0ABR3J667_9AGAR
MAPPARYPDPPSDDMTYPSPSQSHPDYKASYDDLIDEYSSPYAVTSNHKTFNVDVDAPLTPTGNHYRGPSKPVSLSQTTTKHSEDFDSPHSAYPPGPPLKEADTRTFWQKVLPESLACRLYVMTVLIETTIDLAIEGDLLVRFNRMNTERQVTDEPVNSKMPVYLTIFALAHVFQFVMAVDAVYARNTLQFLFLAVFNALFLAYAIIQIGEIRNALPDDTRGLSSISINILTTIIPIVISISELLYIGLGYKIYHEFGWKVYKALGADRRIKKMFANYQIFECLVKFDVFFWVGFSVQFIWIVLKKDDWEYYVTWAALPLSLVLLVEGHLAARHENKWMMATFLSGCVGAMVYFIYKLAKVIINNNDEFTLVRNSLSIFSVLALLLLLATIIFAVIVMRNFGRGLKTSMARGKSTQHNRFASQGPHHRAASMNPNRMSID